MSKDPVEKHKAWKREHRDKPAHVKFRSARTNQHVTHDDADQNQDITVSERDHG